MHPKLASFISFLLVAITFFSMPQKAGSQNLTFSDPVYYCEAHQIADGPGRDYAGPKVPAWMSKALKAKHGQSVRWRCLQGRVLACVDSGASEHCGKSNVSRVPTVPMRNFCKSSPNSSIPTAVTGSSTIFNWTCRGRNPVIQSQWQEVDPSGYPVGTYLDVTRFGPKLKAHVPQPRLKFVPAEFQGRWSHNKKFCSDLEDDSALVLRSNSISFYEGGGKINHVTRQNENTILISTTMEGEGSVWKQAWTFSLLGNGSQLVVTATAGTLDYGTGRYVRCN